MLSLVCFRMEYIFLSLLYFMESLALRHCSYQLCWFSQVAVNHPQSQQGPLTDHGFADFLSLFLYLRPGYREIISCKRHESVFSGEDALFGFLVLHGTCSRPARKPIRKWKRFVCGSGLAGQCLLQTVPARCVGIIELNVSVEDEVHSLMMDGQQ